MLSSKFSSVTFSSAIFSFAGVAGLEPCCSERLKNKSTSSVIKQYMNDFKFHTLIWVNRKYQEDYRQVVVDERHLQVLTFQQFA